MLTFCGFEIELFVEAILARDNGPTLCRAFDYTAKQWLIVRVDDNPDRLAWVCVPVSERAIQAVTNGEASLRDVIRHSATGAVDLVIVDHGRAVPDVCLLCADIPPDLREAADRRMLSAA